MNTNFNYSGFIDMFLESNDDFESYGVITESLELLEPQAQSVSAKHYSLSRKILTTLD